MIHTKFFFLSSVVFTALLLWQCKKANKLPVAAVRESIVFKDTSFWQEYHEGFPLSRESNDVRSISIDNESTVWITTSEGAFKKLNNSSEWINAIPKNEQGPSFSTLVDQHGAVWISNWKNVYRYKNETLERMQTVRSPISVLTESHEGVYAIGPHGIWHFTHDGCEKINYATARSVRDAVVDKDDNLWLATDVGLYHCTKDTIHHYYEQNELVSAYVKGIDFDNSNKLWAGGLGGLTIRNKNGVEKIVTTKDGIPTAQVNCVRYSPDGVMWIGTDVGVVRFSNDHSHTLRYSRRWLMDDKVNDITFDKNGNAWIATANGVSAIKRKKMTLASKQNYFYDVLMRRHIREPWIAGQCRLTVAGDTASWEPEDDDNDGEYTGNYLAMESFRYAATGSEDAGVKARKAFNFLKLLQEVTDTDGFFARTIVPSNWKNVHDGNRIFTEQQRADELVKEPRFKPDEVRWRKSKDEKWLWKGDTSSDEICGHMFGYFFYYELVADVEEKKIVGEHVARIVDYLIKHNYTLTDVDGTHTRWGVWSPDKLNRDPEWQPDRSLNSMELLSFLKLAYHVTGDEKYQKEYLHLIHDEGYLDNMANIQHQNPAWFIYFDVILAAYQYPILLKCEKDPELLRFYQKHIDEWIERRKDDKNPLINFIYCYSRDKKIELKSSIEFLTDTPLDLIDWTIDHTKREDVEFVRKPVLDEMQVAELPPASIRSTVRWDKNPWGINNGNPHLEREPVFWLLPYWMGKYLNMIE